MTPSPSSPSQLKVASWLIYATKSDQEAAKRVRTLIVDIKMDRYRCAGKFLIPLSFAGQKAPYRMDFEPLREPLAAIYQHLRRW